MNERKDGGPAFPRPAVLPSITTASGQTLQTFYQAAETGMSLRDYFAAAAVAGARASLGFAPTCTAVARYAYLQADAMLTERDK